MPLSTALAESSLAVYPLLFTPQRTSSVQVVLPKQELEEGVKHVLLSLSSFRDNRMKYQEFSPLFFIVGLPFPMYTRVYAYCKLTCVMRPLLVVKS